MTSPGLTQLNHFLGHQVTQFQQVWVLQFGLDLLAQGQLWALKQGMGRNKVSTRVLTLPHTLKAMDFSKLGKTFNVVCTHSTHMVS